jgi:hypothetical protein
MGFANLSGPRAKLRRAEEHLHVADSESQTHIEQYPEAGDIELWYESPWYLVRFKPFPPFPLHLALVLGDCIHNICAALDHLIWQLVLREDQEPGQHHSFPLCQTREDFIDKVKLPAQRGKKKFPLYGIPVDGDAWTIIEQAQPFLTGQPQRHPLWFVSYLNNVDKHRTILVQYSRIDVQEFIDHLRWVPDLQPIEQRVTTLFPSGEEPTELARFRFAGNAPVSMYMDSYEVGLPLIGDGKRHATVAILNVARLQVEQILNQVATLPRVQG